MEGGGSLGTGHGAWAFARGFVWGTTQQASLYIDGGAMVQAELSQGHARTEGAATRCEVGVGRKGQHGSQRMKQVSAKDVIPDSEGV